MLDELTPAQRELADCMSELSEAAYCAGWMLGLEYALWDAAHGGLVEYGRLRMSPQSTARLRALSDACGGWIVFDETTEETWLPLREWEARYAERAAHGG
ncbi:MAG: hypothetical protein EPO68_12645 [Planctomycetota bacterium]|nr:MAG: hypothetical protein EPO68_12645 [Planctomycetota bacterium]